MNSRSNSMLALQRCSLCLASTDVGKLLVLHRLFLGAVDSVLEIGDYLAAFRSPQCPRLRLEGVDTDSRQVRPLSREEEVTVLSSPLPNRGSEQGFPSLGVNACCG